MLRIRFTWFVLMLSLFGGGVFVASEVSSASYDYYVKEGENGDGSEDDPFGSIKDAVEAIGDSKGKKIYVSSGSYGAAVTVPKGTIIVGADAKTVTITGDLVLSDGVELEKLGFTKTGDILVLKNAHVELEKLRFKDINKVAIKTEPGNTVVVVRDTTIENAGKGLYLQAGTRAEIENVEVVGGREEGADIRENVTGFIKNSSFRNNQESGVEIILGSAEFVFSGNTFSGNAASGIAAQFFHGAKKFGDVQIKDNTFSKNRYGVDCKAPQGNLDSALYYLNSLKIENNTYKENEIGEISPACKILTDEERLAFEREKAEQQAIQDEHKANLSLNSTELADRLQKSIEFRKTKLEQYALEEQARLHPVFQAIDVFIQAGDTGTDAIGKQRTDWMCYVVGSTKGENDLKESIQEIDGLITRLMEEKTALRYESNQIVVDEKITQLRSLEEKMRETLQSPVCRFSFLGWINHFFGSKGESLFESQGKVITLLNTNPESKILFLGTLAYYPKVREVAVRSGDERLVAGLIETAASYSELIGDLRLPLGDETDPLPSIGSVAELAFPARFSNIFAAANLDVMHLSNAAQILTDPAPFRRTAANLSYADIQTLGKIQNEIPDREVGEMRITTRLGARKLHWVDYRENSGSLAALREIITPLKEKNEPVIVVIAWDEKQGRAIGPKREELLQEIVKAGASLVIGTGLIIPYEQKTIENVSVYTSLGSAFEKFQTGDTSKKSVALEIGIEADGKLVVSEKGLVFTTEKGLEILP